MTDDDIKHLRALCDAATAGEWTLEYDRNEQHNVYSGEEWIAIIPHQCVTSIEQQRNHDAAFIAAARTALPALLDEVERLRALRDPLRPLTEAEVVAALHEGRAQRRAAQGDNAWASLLRQRDELQWKLTTAERDRDAYRAMLADLVAAMPPSDRLAPIVARARDLLKNGPTPAAREPVYRCGVCLDGTAPCPVIDPKGVGKWTCLACGRIVGSGKGASDE